MKTDFTCFNCRDGNTPLYCLNCATELIKPLALVRSKPRPAWAKNPTTGKCLGCDHSECDGNCGPQSRKPKVPRPCIKCGKIIFTPELCRPVTCLDCDGPHSPATPLQSAQRKLSRTKELFMLALTQHRAERKTVRHLLDSAIKSKDWAMVIRAKDGLKSK